MLTKVQISLRLGLILYGHFCEQDVTCAFYSVVMRVMQVRLQKLEVLWEEDDSVFFSQ